LRDVGDDDDDDDGDDDDDDDDVLRAGHLELVSVNKLMMRLVMRLMM